MAAKPSARPCTTADPTAPVELGKSHHRKPSGRKPERSPSPARSRQQLTCSVRSVAACLRAAGMASWPLALWTSAAMSSDESIYNLIKHEEPAPEKGPIYRSRFAEAAKAREKAAPRREGALFGPPARN
eukprot:m51a1_g13129 hypothetical protein (129) ;mRNA; f:238-2086